MLKCNLAVLLAERNLKISKVSKDTGISRTTLTSLAYNSSQGVQFETLNALCSYLRVTPNDFFSFAPINFSVTSKPIDDRKFEVILSILDVKKNVIDSVTLELICTNLRDKVSKMNNPLKQHMFDLLADEDEVYISVLIKYPKDIESVNFLARYIKPLTPTLKNLVENELLFSILDQYHKKGVYNIGAGIYWEDEPK